MVGGGAHFVAVPGILARVQEQVNPLLPALGEHSMVVSGFNYTGTRFTPEPMVEELVTLVHRNISIDQPTILFGSSLGGMVIALALTELRRTYSVETLNGVVRTIIVDAPSGPRDLILAPFLPGVVNPFVGRLIRRFTPNADANHGYGKRLLSTFRVPPKDEEIEIPNAESMDEQSLKEAHKAIKQTAIEGLSGHLFTVWYDQLRWMLNNTLDLSALDGLNVIYLRCVKGNMTVRQPQASKAWEPSVKFTQGVDMPHCAYLQAPETATEALNLAIAVGELLQPQL